jgi:hypothetical protein
MRLEHMKEMRLEPIKCTRGHEDNMEASGGVVLMHGVAAHAEP